MNGKNLVNSEELGVFERDLGIARHIFFLVPASKSVTEQQQLLSRLIFLFREKHTDRESFHLFILHFIACAYAQDRDPLPVTKQASKHSPVPSPAREASSQENR